MLHHRFCFLMRVHRRKRGGRCLLGVLALVAFCAARAGAEGTPHTHAQGEGASAARAAAPPEAVRSFQSFCASWMDKLRARETRNLATARQVSHGESFEYTGYSSKPMRCEALATGVAASPFVGKIVYLERLYRGGVALLPAGPGETQTEVLQELEVLEIFRFDGDDWKY